MSVVIKKRKGERPSHKGYDQLQHITVTHTLSSKVFLSVVQVQVYIHIMFAFIRDDSDNQEKKDNEKLEKHTNSFI